MPHLYIFGLKYENNIVIFEISTLEFREIMKMPKFGTKNVVCGYFWARI